MEVVYLSLLSFLVSGLSKLQTRALHLGKTGQTRYSSEMHVYWNQTMDGAESMWLSQLSFLPSAVLLHTQLSFFTSR